MNINYKAIDNKGQLVNASAEAKDRYELINQLKAQGLTVIEMTETESPTNENKSWGGLEFFGVSQVTVSFFTRQLAELIDAGIPLVECLNSLRRFSPSGPFVRILDQVIADIQRGSTLHEALARHPQAFDSLYVNLVQVGEASGNIPEMFNRLADYQEQQMEIRGKIRAALTYPCFILAFSFVLVYGLVAYLLPSFEPMWKNAGLDLHRYPVTMMLMSLSSLTTSWLDEIFAVFFVGSIWFGFRALTRTPEGGRAWDRFTMKLPLLGNFSTLASMARVASTLSTMLNSGLPLLQALEMSGKVAGNRAVSESLADITREVATGKRISAAFDKHSDVFPPLMVQMISIGDVSGQIDKMLPRVARYYQSQLDAALKAFAALIEPITMVLVGGVVFTFVIGVFMPIMGVVGALQQKM